MAILPPTSEQAAAILREAGFEQDVAYMEVPRCDSCRWWGPKNWRGDYNACEAVTHAEDVTGKAIAPGSYGEYADEGLLTRADFGCVLWEAKP